MRKFRSVARKAMRNESGSWVVDDGDTLMEPGELGALVVDCDDIVAAALVAAGGDGGTLALTPNNRWTIEVQTPVGAVLDITRSYPAQMDAVMQLL